MKLVRCFFKNGSYFDTMNFKVRVKVPKQKSSYAIVKTNMVVVEKSENKEYPISFIILKENESGQKFKKDSRELTNMLRKGLEKAEARENH